jgi:hypothetical protein
MSFDFTDRRMQAYGLNAVAIILLLLSAWCIWLGVRTWIAVRALERHQLYLLVDPGRQSPELRQSAAQVSDSLWSGNDPRLIIPVMDPAQGVTARMNDALRGASSADRDQTLAAISFTKALKGEAINTEQLPETADWRLVRLIADLKEAGTGQMPAWPDVQGASYGILRAALERDLAAAWKVGNDKRVLASAGQLRTLDPRHPAAAACDVLLYLGSGGNAETELKTMMGKVPDVSLRPRLLRAAARILPSNSNFALSLLHEFGADNVDPEEYINSMVLSGKDLAAITAKVLTLKNSTLLCRVFDETIAKGRVDLAQKIQAASGLTPEDRQRLGEVLAVAMGSNLGVSLLRGEFGFISFHLTTPEGKVSRLGSGDVRITVDGRPLTSDDVVHFGSLFHCKIPGRNKVKLEITVKGKKILSQEVVR